MEQCKKNRYLQCLLLGFVLITGYACVEKQTPWEQIQKSGQLRFVTIDSPLTCYRTPVRFTGIECDLAGRFAAALGVELVLIMVHDPQAVVQMVKEGRADIGGAGLMGPVAHNTLNYGPAWNHTTLQLVYRSGSEKPKSIESLGNYRIPVLPYQADLLQHEYPQAQWHVVRHQDIESLLRNVQQGSISATVADSNQLTIYRHLYPDLRVAFALTGPQPVAWVYRHDVTLDSKISEFVTQRTENGELTRLLEQYFGHARQFDRNDASTFLTMIRERLPEYKQLFRDTALYYGMEWTMLAAMCYQESHWFAGARSPTGVRGLMMLTKDTAAYLDIGDRVNPRQSVEGGARYFRLLLDKLPERISEPDRTWLALAAYNIGFQHLEDARILTQNHGGNPDAWQDVRKYLPLLSDYEWHTQTAFGRARGGEAVRYAENIRRYLDILRWLHIDEDKNEIGQRNWLEWMTVAPVNLYAM